MRFVDGHPAVGVAVAAFDRDLRSEEPLGTATTGRDGAYHIEYSQGRFRKRERGTADLVVRALDANGAALVASPVLFNAPRIARVDLTIPASTCPPPPLFDKLAAAIAPLAAGVALAELDEGDGLHDLSFLAGETAFAQATVARFALTYRLQGEPCLWFALLGGGAWTYDATQSLAAQLPAVRTTVYGLDEAAVRRTVANAVAARDIAAPDANTLDAWVRAFLSAATAAAIGTPAAPTFLGQALASASLTTADQQAKVAGLVQGGVLTPAAIASLRTDKAFTAAQVDDLATTYQLATVVGTSDFGVVSLLKAQLPAQTPAAVPQLARLGASDWATRIAAAQKAGTLTVPIAIAQSALSSVPPTATLYAQGLAQQLATAFPTPAFAGELDRAIAANSTRGVPQPAAVSQFLAANTDFDLLTTRIDPYLAQSATAKDAAQDQARAQFATQLKAVQRVFKLAPSFAATDAMLADGVHSAQQTYRLGQSEVVRRYASKGLGVEGAKAVWRRAADTHAMVISIVGDLKAMDPEQLPVALQGAGADALSTFPNWDNLFAGGDTCACDECRSVLGPAAYFADLMVFLRDRNATVGKVSDVLHARRPDLEYLELGCDNALVTLPYIDVVCEVLEAVVAAGGDAIPLALAAIPADPASADTAVATALAAASIDVGTAFTLAQIDPADPSKWIVHGDAATYLLQQGGATVTATVLPNIKASAEELRAYPAYVSTTAYAKLAAARSPFALPFALFDSEVRAGFAKSAIARWDLMRTFQQPAAAGVPAPSDIAAEYFGIAADPAAAFDEKRLILTTDPASQQTLWGEDGNAGWLADVANVKVFLQKTGLDYDELLALIDLSFFGALAIVHLDASCDTDKQQLSGLTADALDRVHRFLRLWRKLPAYESWELALVIAQLGGGALDEPFLVKLWSFELLRARLGAKITVEQACGLFADLNTASHFTAAFEPRADALYQTLFLNKRLVQPIDPAFAVGAAATGLADHLPTVLAALGVREADYDLLAAAVDPASATHAPYNDGTTALANLSFLWRHAWLAKTLGWKLADWVRLLALDGVSRRTFGEPATALAFVDNLDVLAGSGFSADELAWALAADRTSKAAIAEADAARLLSTLRAQLAAVLAQYAVSSVEALNPPSDPDALGALLTQLLQSLHRDEAGAAFVVAALSDTVSLTAPVAGLPVGFTFPAAIAAAIPIRYDAAASVLRYTGYMTDAQHATLRTDPSLAVVTAVPAYLAAVDSLYGQPRAAIALLDPVFEAPLAALPVAVMFTTLPAGLAQRVSYDGEARVLRVTGVLSGADQAALDALSIDAAYRAAVQAIYDQPRAAVIPAAQRWLTDADLVFPLAANIPENLATAITKAMAYLSTQASADAVVQATLTQLGLTEDLAQRLLGYAVLAGGATSLDYFVKQFAVTAGVVDYATLPDAFDAWFWLARTALLWTRWKLALIDVQQLDAIAEPAKLLDVTTLPRSSAAAQASLDRLRRTSRIFRVAAALPETSLSLLELLANLAAGQYATPHDFGAAVALVDDAWPASDVAALASMLDLAYPADYLLAETWERMQRAFSFTSALSASVPTAARFAKIAMAHGDADALKGLLRAKLGSESWLALATEIQDTLRDAKRDALCAYLLAQPAPADVPTGKWEDTNDLYAYYLLDVEMCACQLTSRLVQASGSIQLFVQRCFMGLEPNVAVVTDGDNGDTAWLWWSWMSKYRVWQANREVFLWPENWIAPELKPDRSSFFKDLETALLQNDVTPDAVEPLFAAYLEQLDGVAQLELSGFYQQDIADQTILHVFGRTKGAQPHRYYYRTYDYRQWSPWQLVDLDIAGDYLIPAVIGSRLFLFWPIFTEVADEAANSTLTTPNLNAPFTIPRTQKNLQIQMAVSDYRQGAWTPKRVSKDYAQSAGPYAVDVTHSAYVFVPFDRSDVDGTYGIRFSGSSLDQSGKPAVSLGGCFEVASCAGVPVLSFVPGFYQAAWVVNPQAVGYLTVDGKYAEETDRGDAPANDLTLISRFAASSAASVTLLDQTPWLFRVTPPLQLSYLDRLALNAQQAVGQREHPAPLGSWMPFFYDDKKRTFFVLPKLGNIYYPQVKQLFSGIRATYESNLTAWVDAIDLTQLTVDQRASQEQLLWQQFPEEPPPPYTDAQFRALVVRYFMQWIDVFLSYVAELLFRYRQFEWKSFYHPFVCDFATIVNDPLRGIDGLMTREVQLQDSGFSFAQNYVPTSWSPAPYPQEVVDFCPDGAYAQYNWELFFHAPLLVANALSQNQQFEAARDWYHYIFNPIGVESATPGGAPTSKYWITKPFYETTEADYIAQRIENLLGMLAAGQNPTDTHDCAIDQALPDQVLDWRRHPFEPHRIAAYRTVAYQKTVFMKYLDNLIAWGDSLFQQDSMESINEATQLYVLAAELLGPKPMHVPPQAKPPLETFAELLHQNIDAFSNALVEVENLVPAQAGGAVTSGDPTAAPLPMLYFCVPQNDRLHGYWDTVADRLYKIRHCMNIDGVVRQLSLFEPPIDPGALVKAVAAGVDIGAALADLGAALPLVRFSAILARANSVCADVRGLGTALLAVLEKNDAEGLALLRQSHEISLLQAVLFVRQQQVDEANDQLTALKNNQVTVTARRDYYQNIVRISPGEQLQQDKLADALGSQQTAQAINIAASIAHVVPSFDIGAAGAGGSPRAGVQFGGPNVGSALQAVAGGFQYQGNQRSYEANKASIDAGHDRRWDDWKLQELLANKELAQIASQIDAATLRVTIAKQELANQQLQIDHAKSVDAFMRSKYTNQDLYQWQIGQVSGVYFQAYKLALDLAKRAERCYRFELGIADSSYITATYWDSLKRGLLAGDKLQYDLRRLEVAYQDQNRRELELTKHVSLEQLDPAALIMLKETGSCFFSMPEELFDHDYPGHYFRRIKSVSITLPCVAGPYVTVAATLRLLKGSIRTTTAAGAGYPRATDDSGAPTDDPRFADASVQVKAIAASSAQNDSGLFELSFRDDRYLPFEGAGAISDWKLELFNDATAADFGRALRQFDYDSIPDAIVHVKYTAREDAGPFKTRALAHLRDYFAASDPAPATLAIDLQRDLPTQWSRFQSPTDPTAGNVFEFPFGLDRFPLRDAGSALEILNVRIFARASAAGAYTVDGPGATATLAASTAYGGLHVGDLAITPVAVPSSPTTWSFRFHRPGGTDLLPGELTEAIVILTYHRI